MESPSENAFAEFERLENLRFAEMARQAEELRVRDKELLEDRKALDAEREAIFHQQAIERRQLEEQQAEVRRQQQEIQRDLERKLEEMRQQKFAERKAEDDLLAAIAADEAEVYRLAELHALKPEFDKAQRFCRDLDAWAEAYLNVIGAKWAGSALIKLERACNEILKDLKKE